MVDRHTSPTVTTPLLLEQHRGHPRILIITIDKEPTKQLIIPEPATMDTLLYVASLVHINQKLSY